MYVRGRLPKPLINRTWLPARLMAVVLLLQLLPLLQLPLLWVPILHHHHRLVGRLQELVQHQRPPLHMQGAA